MDEVHKITIQTRAPKGFDPGKVAIGHYVTVDGFVVLTDEHGKARNRVEFERAQTRS
jgi:hypothetical protein